MGIHTINLVGGINNLPPSIEPLDPPNIGKNENSKTLMSDEDIDKLIDSQIPKQEPTIQIPIKPEEIRQPPIIPISNEKQDELKFDLNGMNDNLDEIRKNTLERIKSLADKQAKISARIDLIEKFIILDEKSLALESSKSEPNAQRIFGIKKSIFSQTELISEVTDILLKFEAQIQGWYKTLMDVEKDKVSAYNKIKSVNKEQLTTESDITDVLSNLNQILKNDPNKLLDATSNTLNIGGYSGKKFNG